MLLMFLGVEGIDEKGWFLYSFPLDISSFSECHVLR